MRDPQVADEAQKREEAKLKSDDGKETALKAKAEGAKGKAARRSG